MAFLGFPSRGDWYRDGDPMTCLHAWRPLLLLRPLLEREWQPPTYLFIAYERLCSLTGGEYAQQEICEVARILSQYQAVTICTNADQV